MSELSKQQNWFISPSKHHVSLKLLWLFCENELPAGVSTEIMTAFWLNDSILNFIMVARDASSSYGAPFLMAEIFMGFTGVMSPYL